MKRSLINLVASLVLLGLGWLVPHSVFSVGLETAPTATSIVPTGTVSAIAPQAETGIPTATAFVPAPTDIPTPMPDPYGEVYFTILTPKVYLPPAEPPVGVDETAYRLARLPGSCVVGLMPCPAPETIQTPFNMRDVYMVDGRGLVWSPDGRYALLVIHPEDELSAGKTKEEMAKIANQSPEEFQINPSTLYLYDAELDIWKIVYSAERKFFYSPTWSPDGQWIAFQVLSSQWAFHAAQPDDGLYLVRPDGTEPHQIGSGNASIQGWVGNSLFLRRVTGLYPAQQESFELLTLDGKITPLFDAQRVAFYALAPDGGSLLAADAQGEFSGSPVKSVDLLALDGGVIQNFGTFSNQTGSIYPLAWSKDASRVAFASLRRVYVGTPTVQAAPSGMAGLPADGTLREVYVADDRYVSPSIWQLQFSHDNQYLLMDVYDGQPRLVVVSLKTGQAAEVIWKEASSDEQATAYSWRP